MNQQHPYSQFQLSTSTNSSEYLPTLTMPPKLRSSSSKASSASNVASASTEDNIDDISLVVPDSIGDSFGLETVMDSIKAAQRAIDAITLRLTAQTDSIDATTKHLSKLEHNLDLMNSTITDLPESINMKLATVSQELRTEFSSTLHNFSTAVHDDITSFRSDTNACFKNHVTTIGNLGDTVLALTKNLTILQETTLSKPDIENLIVQKWEDELDPHIKSHYDFKTEATTRLDFLDRTLQDTVSTLKHHSQIVNSSSIRQTSSRTIGFHQPTSKDFSASKLQKELKEIKLFGDTLKDLEIFWDAILGAFTNLCQINQAYPYYRDLSSTFDFELHFVEPIKPPKFLPIDSDQVKKNYRCFGDVLRIFLHSGTTIDETSSPKTYLQLLSYCDTRDGFLLLRNLIFSLSPQLSGNYHDYRQDIDLLEIIPGEHLSKFYQRIIKLSNEITLSNIQNGNLALLAFRFISLLRSTKCATIIGLLNPYWKEITKHRRNPKHITTLLPWKFKDVYDDLISSDVLHLPTTSGTSFDTSILPIAAKGFSPVHLSSNNKNSTLPSSKSTTTIGIHRTRDGRKFISHQNKILSPKQPACQLCFNKHANPWHPTNECPYKHPTHIIPKDIRERVMQHNALHGAENPNYTKNQDIPNATSVPRQATGNSATTLDSSHKPFDSTANTPDTGNIDDQPVDSHVEATTPIINTSDEIVDTEYFDIPFIDAIANAATVNNLHPYADIEADTVITDHLQYLSYES
jgi:hypothetical protein